MHTLRSASREGKGQDIDLDCPAQHMDPDPGRVCLKATKRVPSPVSFFVAWSRVRGLQETGAGDGDVDKDSGVGGPSRRRGRRRLSASEEVRTEN